MLADNTNNWHSNTSTIKSQIWPQGYTQLYFSVIYDSAKIIYIRDNLESANIAMAQLLPSVLFIPAEFYSS